MERSAAAIYGGIRLNPVRGTGNWKLETGNLKMETGKGKLETENWRIEIGNSKLGAGVEAKRNKPNAAKGFDINRIREKEEKQTQWGYPQLYQ